MLLISKTYWEGSPVDFRIAPTNTKVEPIRLTADDRQKFKGLYYTSKENANPQTAILCMHPRADFTEHYTFPRLLAAGYGCLGAHTRNPNNDVNTVHEDIIRDVAACVNYLKSERGVKNVVLLGNSGGGSLAAFPTRFHRSKWQAGDGMIYLSSHKGEGAVCMDCIDPAVVDETDPFKTNKKLDMYNPANRFAEPPTWSKYSKDFIAAFRAGQKERVERLDQKARELVEQNKKTYELSRQPEFKKWNFEKRQRVLKQAAFQPVMVIYRTTANPHYVDHHLDPSGREYGSIFSNRPDLMNMQLLGWARLCTPHAWLSTWSGLSSNADMMQTLQKISQPSLVVNAGRDKEIFPETDAKPLFAALAAEDKTHIELPNARHYFEPDYGEKETPDIEELMNQLIPWLEKRFSA